MARAYADPSRLQLAEIDDFDNAGDIEPTDIMLVFRNGEPYSAVVATAIGVAITTTAWTAVTLLNGWSNARVAKLFKFARSRTSYSFGAASTAPNQLTPRSFSWLSDFDRRPTTTSMSRSVVDSSTLPPAESCLTTTTARLRQSSP